MNRRSFLFPVTFILPICAFFVLASMHFISESRCFYIHIPVHATAPVTAKLSADSGHGFDVNRSSEINLPEGRSVVVNFKIHATSLNKVRVQLPANGATLFVLGDTIIGSRAGEGDTIPRNYATLPSTRFQPMGQIYRIVDIGSQRSFATTSQGVAALILDAGSISLPPDYSYLWPRLLAVLAISGALGFGAARAQRSYSLCVNRVIVRVKAFAVEHSITAITAAALLGVIASCYPVVFFGKSFLSPNLGTVLLYDKTPTVPDADPRPSAYEDPLNSDVGAMIWYDQPNSAIQSRALLREREIPLWNRDNWCGVPLLGQGQSMFGDPLHFIVLFANSSAIAWDLKFLLAKFVFAAAIGFATFSLTRHLPTSLFLAFASCFIGFFPFRFNHPAFFSFCYSPLILLCWIRIADSLSRRPAVFWMLGLFVANWMEINSGTVKEAYMLLLSFNATGLLIFLLAKAPTGLKKSKALDLVFVGLAFILATAPFWWTFLDALNKSFTFSDTARVAQVQLRFVIGIFDDLFYREINTNEGFLLPSANLVVLLGCSLTVAYCYFLRSNRALFAIALATVIPFCMVFGIIPPQFIECIPFIGRIVNIHVVFSNVVIVQVILLAGYGIAHFLTAGSVYRRVVGVLIIWAGLASLLCVYFFDVNGVELVLSRTFKIIAAFIITSAAILPVALALTYRFRVCAPIFNQVAAACIFLLLWRHGLGLNTRSEVFDKFVFNPQPRAVLNPVSAALENVRPRTGDAGRIIGFENNLLAGYNDTQDLESISGPDPLEPKPVREMVLASGLECSWLWRITVHPSNLEASRRALDLLNVRYYATLPEQIHTDPPGLEKVASSDLVIYRSNSAWPRAFFTDAILSYSSASDFAELVRTTDGRPFAAVDRSEISAQPVLRGLAGRDVTKRQVVEATNYALTVNHTSFDISAPGAGIVVLSETYFPDDFRASVNGDRANYLRVNYGFKGIQLNGPGAYHITFDYWPKHFTKCLISCAAGFLLLLVWFARAIGPVRSRLATPAIVAY